MKKQILFLMIGALILSFNVFSQDAEVLTKTGTVVSVDAALGTATINIGTLEVPDNVVFYTDIDSVVSKGEELIALDSVMPGDSVEVSYSVDSQGKNIINLLFTQTAS